MTTKARPVAAAESGVVTATPGQRLRVAVAHRAVTDPGGGRPGHAAAIVLAGVSGGGNCGPGHGCDRPYPVAAGLAGSCAGVCLSGAGGLGVRRLRLPRRDRGHPGRSGGFARHGPAVGGDRCRGGGRDHRGLGRLSDRTPLGDPSAARHPRPAAGDPHPSGQAPGLGAGLRPAAPGQRGVLRPLHRGASGAGAGLAGMSQVEYPVFLAYNVAGGALWGSGLAVLGYLAGRQLPACRADRRGGRAGVSRAHRGGPHGLENAAPIRGPSPGREASATGSRRRPPWPGSGAGSPRRSRGPAPPRPP